MTKKFYKLEWQQIGYEWADAGSCTWEHHEWCINKVNYPTSKTTGNLLAKAAKIIFIEEYISL